MMSSLRFQDYQNFESYVCKAYKGNPPAACQGLGRDDYPIIQQVVEAGNIDGCNSGDLDPHRADDDSADKTSRSLTWVLATYFSLSVIIHRLHFHHEPPILPPPQNGQCALCTVLPF